jgi:protein ImuA
MAARQLLHIPFEPQLRNVWSGGDMDAQVQTGVASGHEALDRELPGNGWPEGGLVEVLQAQPEDHVWRLLLPALASVMKAHAGPVVLINAPREPFGPAMQAQGVVAQRLLAIHADKPAARLWATEQALRCAEVAAVLAWLPQVKSAELRRLHLASCQQQRMFFVLRPLNVAGEASPARLRVRVEGGHAQQANETQGTLRIHILKRRGPPLASPVLLAAQSGRLADLLQARKGRASLPSSRQLVVPVKPSSLTPTPERATAKKLAVMRSAHALDRIALPG